MVAGNIIHFDAAAKHARYLFDYLHVARGPVFFTELPDIDDVTIQY